MRSALANLLAAIPDRRPAIPKPRRRKAPPARRVLGPRSPAARMGIAAVAATAVVVAPQVASALDVVATVPGLASIAHEIAGPHAHVTAMAVHSQDPHFVDAKPSLALSLARADLLLVAGLDLEIGWLPRLLVAARNGRVQPGSRGYLDCSRAVHRLDVRTGAVDRSMGDIHPAGNPHYLVDPRAGAAVARAIATRLGEIDPTNAKTYQSNLTGFLQRLDKARVGWQARLARLRGAPVVTYHRSWTYLFDWLGLQEAGFIEPKPGIPPNPRHVAALLGTARQRGVKLILVEDYYPDKTARLVAGKLGARLLRLSGQTAYRDGQSYQDYVAGVVSALAQAAPGSSRGGAP